MDTFDEYIVNSLYDMHKPSRICIMLDSIKCKGCHGEFMDDIELSFHMIQNMCTNVIITSNSDEDLELDLNLNCTQPPSMYEGDSILSSCVDGCTESPSSIEGYVEQPSFIEDYSTQPSSIDVHTSTNVETSLDEDCATEPNSYEYDVETPVEAVVLDKELNQCAICGEICNSSKFNDHIVTHCNLETNTCNICNKTLSTKGNLKVHMVMIHCNTKKSNSYKIPKTPVQLGLTSNTSITNRSTKSTKCTVCGNMYNDSNFNAHVMSHCNLKTNKCNICNKFISNRSNLKTHMMTVHYNIKKFECHICGYKCAHSYALKKHILTHKHEHKFSCKTCDRKFTKMNGLVLHMKVCVTKVTKPSFFKCKRCHKKYKSEGCFKKHQSKCLALACDICELPFNSLYALKQHKSERHYDINDVLLEPIDKDKYQFKCLLCDESFTRECNLIAHQSTHN